MFNLNDSIRYYLYPFPTDLLRPLYYRLRELVLESDYLQVDETTLPIVHEEKHKTVKGYIWMLRSVMRDLVFFHYDHGSRAQKVVIPLLKDFQGALQTDGYEVYKMYENKKGVLPLGCWAHVIRKFEEALINNSLYIDQYKRNRNRLDFTIVYRFQGGKSVRQYNRDTSNEK